MNRIIRYLYTSYINITRTIKDKIEKIFTHEWHSVIVDFL